MLAFGEQSGVNVAASRALIEGKTAPAVRGEMDPTKALNKILLNSGLKSKELRSGAYTITLAAANVTGRNVAPHRAAQASKQTPQKANTSARPYDEEAEEDPELRSGFGKLSADELDEIVITGSHIKGVKSASPVFVFGRTDIEQTGISTIPDFLRTLPQVFGGGQSETTAGLSGANNADQNLSVGSGINLRGLGTESTLVLLNGHRLAATGVGDFVDVSLFPLTAIERVEVLIDGASALYGSDAVGGVVNFVLRKDYSGAETRVRYGTATDGSTDDIQIGQVVGDSWDRGHALISYEYRKRHHLDSEERSFTKDSADPTYLLPDQERHSLFFTGGYEVSEDISLFGDAFYSERKGTRYSSVLSSISSSDSTSHQYGTNIGAEIEIGENWQAEISGTYNKSKTSSVLEIYLHPFGPSISPLVSFPSQQRTEVWSVDATTTGKLFSISGGDIKLATGVQYRNEHFYTLRDSVPESDLSRDIFAVFTELNIPLVSENNRFDGVEALELTLAGRLESYSDFGTSIDPKIGLIWSPLSGLQARGTYSTSFRAPILENLSEYSVSAVMFNLPDPASPTGETLSVIALGNNAALKEESANTWTVGFDIKPPSLPGFNLGVTYFNIAYKDRIEAGDAFFDAFLVPRFAPLIDRNPDLNFIEFLFESPFSFNGTASDPIEAEALVDNRLRNVSRLATSGLDVTMSYAFDADIGFFNVNINTTYLLKREIQLFETEAAFGVLDTVNNPADLKVRGGLSWASGNLSSSLFVNYVDGYHDERMVPVVDVDSWTTVDLQLRYQFDDDTSNGLLTGTELSISVQNLFDQAPPFVFNVSNRNFDSNNASALGRFVAFQLIKHW
ncbi:MAG: TonB-dependent receptor [Kordiimonadaceae bacterium]|nr:TonB-dependent receptor [Kordiimonadaceae bacterium]